MLKSQHKLKGMIIMIEIKGKINKAICYTSNIEESAKLQIEKMCSYPLSENSNIRIMPDVHAGKGCTIGTTMTISDKACPNIVGVDIGCGMYTVKLLEKNLDFAKIDEAAHYIPSGMDVWDGRKEKFDLQKLKCYRELKNTKRLERSLGTLGGGNHFIEIEVSKDGTYYLVIHTGSRNLGKQVAEIYQNLAIDLHKGKELYFNKRDKLIKTYKEQGRRKEIQAALVSLADEYQEKELEVPSELCWLYGKFLDDYLYDIKICQSFANRNREKIAEIIMDKANLHGVDAFHTIHNYIDTDEMILRKGAIAAHNGEKVLIPINMRDGSILAIGKGNKEWNYSAPHGAGRIMSRTEAKNSLSMDNYLHSMEGIYTTSVNEATLDESPMAYKSIDEILSVIDDTAEVVEVLKPVYNFKALY